MCQCFQQIHQSTFGQVIPDTVQQNPPEKMAFAETFKLNLTFLLAFGPRLDFQPQRAAVESAVKYNRDGRR